jgi:acyl carrier protein
VYLDSLPLTPNGKVDRSRLQEPVWAGYDGKRPYKPPTTPAEERIAEMWAEILGVKQVGVNDNFFSQLAGHSLLATRVVSRIRETYQVDVPLRQFFEGPTVAEMALAVEELLIDELEAMDENRLNAS